MTFEHIASRLLVQFINGTRPGNPQLVELAKRQVGNVGGYPYWSW